MTEIQYKIIEQLRSGPESLPELFTHIGRMVTPNDIDDALTSLLDARKIVFMQAVGLYALGAES
jgi:hypothetical protein